MDNQHTGPPSIIKQRGGGQTVNIPSIKEILGTEKSILFYEGTLLLAQLESTLR